jgi:hypothetical protein
MAASVRSAKMRWPQRWLAQRKPADEQADRYRPTLSRANPQNSVDNGCASSPTLSDRSGSALSDFETGRPR